MMRVSNSPLVTYTNLSRNHSGRRTQPITKIAIHHMYAVWSGKRCADYFATTKRQTSSNYCIGVNGDIAMSVEEKNRAWTTSSNWCDQRAVTIEVANSSLSGDTPVSAASMKSLIALVADICKRNGIKKCTYTGDKSGVLQMHKWYDSTSCPGKYLGSRFIYIAEEVNKLLAPKPTTTKPKAPTQKYKTGLYRVTRSDLNIRKKPDTSKNPVGVINKGTYTIVEVKGDWGKLKSGAGWIHLGFASYAGQAASPKPQPKPQPTPKKSIAEIVAEVKAGKWGNGQTRIDRLKAAGYDPITIQQLVNTKLGIATKTNQQIADEVLAGKWGNGTDRKNKLTAAGYDYNVIQTIVNQTKSTTTHISKSGTWKFNTAVKIRSTPSTSSGDTGLIYTSGMTVNIASTQVADGYVWGKYISHSGKTRYVALQKVNGVKHGAWV